MLEQAVHLMLQPHAGSVGNVVRRIPLRKGKGVGVGRTLGKAMAAGKGFGSVPANSRKKKVKSVSDENSSKVGNGFEGIEVMETDDRDDEDPHGVHRIVDLLPEEARIQLGRNERLQELIEVVMDLGRVPLGRFPGLGDLPLSDLPITMEDLKEVGEKVCEFGGDNRAGIEGTLHRISCIRNRDGEIVGMTCRVGRDIGDSADLISDIVISGKSILLMGQPGIGKTTILRGICRILADACEKRVVIVDTSNEIGGDGDIPHSGIGRSRRMQVPLPENQCQVMIEAVENHMPEVIVVDEIGTETECQAARTIAQRGVQLVATAHGTKLENLMKNPSLQDLIGGITSVTLGDDEARRRHVQKSVLEREGPPVFDVAIEIIDRCTWRIHHNLSEAVDSILAGSVGQGEIRSYNDANDPDSKQKRPLPPTLPVLPNIKLGPLSNAARKAVAEFEAITRETASSAVPLNQNSLAGPAVSGPQTKQRAKDNSRKTDDGAETPGAAKKVPVVEETEGECVAREWFAMGGLHEGDDVVLTLFTFGVDIKLLWEVVDAMELATKVAVTPYLKDADAILGTRTSLKIAGWVQKASQTSGIPLFSIKNCSASQLVRALHSLLGLQPSNTPMASGPNPKIEASAEIPEGMDAEETAVPTSLREDERAALAEIRYVIEDIVIPRHQSCDLLPRLPNVIEMQIKEIHNYGLECVTVGSGNTLHLRILPSGSDKKSNDSLEGALA